MHNQRERSRLAIYEVDFDCRIYGLHEFCQSSGVVADKPTRRLSRYESVTFVTDFPVDFALPFRMFAILHLVLQKRE